MSNGITRLAPSPTGALHVGNARTFVINHLLARQNGWRVLLRIEDLDGPRIKGDSSAMIDELSWLGLEWEGPVVRQSERGELYRQALNRLWSERWAYPCICSRRDIEIAASAPNLGQASAAYPGTCRGRFADESQARQGGRPVAWRVIAPLAPMLFDDRFAGPQSVDLASAGGDFVVFKNDSQAAYQLAVVVDDSAAGVNRIVRGDDLLESCARQIHLRRLLGFDEPIEYWHLPLVIGPDGRRLAKRHGDSRLCYYRRLGCTPQRILGLIGFMCGAFGSRREADMNDLMEAFDIERMSKSPVVFGPDDDAFLAGRKA